MQYARRNAFKLIFANLALNTGWFKMLLKRFSGIIFFLVSILTLLGAEQKTGGNIIKNGDFENGLELWKAAANKTNPSTISIDNDVIFIEGSKSLRIDIKTNPPEVRNGRTYGQAECAYIEKIPCVAGKRFLLSGWMKGTSNVTVVIVVDGGTYNKATWFKTEIITAKSDWTKFKTEVLFPDANSKKYSAERKDVRLRIGIPNENGADGTVWIDSLKFEELK